MVIEHALSAPVLPLREVLLVYPKASEVLLEGVRLQEPSLEEVSPIVVRSTERKPPESCALLGQRHRSDSDLQSFKPQGPRRAARHDSFNGRRTGREPFEDERRTGIGHEATDEKRRLRPSSSRPSNQPCEHLARE